MKEILLIICCVTIGTWNVAGQSDIHKVDFENFTYRPSCTDLEGSGKMESIAVKKGEFSRATEMDGYTDRLYFNILKVTYGDLNGDKTDEAVVLSVCNTGGTGQFSEGFIYTIKAGKPTLLARVPGGDRADGGLRSLTVDNGLLVIEANDSSRSSGACCPEGVIIQKVRLVGSKLVDVGKPVSRELYPKQRLSFDKGTSGTNFTVTIEPDDRKRYVLSARAGQTLTVSVSSKDVDLQMLGDENAETEDNGSLVVKLSTNGDHTFELANGGDKSVKVTVTVTVQIR